MSKKNLSISEQIEALEAENRKLKTYEKCFDILLQSEFGMDKKSIHKALESDTKLASTKQGSSGSFSSEKAPPTNGDKVPTESSI